MEVVNNKEGKPLEFYLEKFKETDPAEMAARCGLPYDGEARAITANLLGERYLTYREFPWGEVYLQQFTGRCIKRFAFSYGSRLDLLEKIMEKLPAKKLSRSDCGWELELMEGLTIQLLLWAGDDEFPPNAQILFSDNFRYAFTAEDLANAGDIVLNRMKRIGAGL